MHDAPFSPQNPCTQFQALAFPFSSFLLGAYPLRFVCRWLEACSSKSVAFLFLRVALSILGFDLFPCTLHAPLMSNVFGQLHNMTDNNNNKSWSECIRPSMSLIIQLLITLLLLLLLLWVEVCSARVTFYYYYYY